MTTQYTYRRLWALAGLCLLGILPAAAQSWDQVAPMPDARYDISAVVLNGEIYVIGGRDRDGNVLNTVLRYHPEENVWEEMPATLHEGRAEAAAAVLGGRIYITGGKDDDEEVIDVVEVYDPTQDQWREVKEMDVERYGHGATVIDGKLYVIGGEDEEKRLVEEVEVYDPETDQWQKSDEWKMDRPRVAFGLVSIGDTAYAFAGLGLLGGQVITPLPSAERFISGNGVHTFQPDQILGVRGYLAVATDGREAYLLGGSGVRGPLDDVTVFTPGSGQQPDRWRAEPRMFTGRERFAAVVVDGRLYAIGGKSRNRNLASVEALQISSSVGIEEDPIADIAAPRLEQNHPNPFATATTIPFVISSGGSGQVVVDVYDVQGRLVERLLNGTLPPGRHEVVWRGGDLALSSGVYFLVLRQGNSIHTRTLTRTR